MDIGEISGVGGALPGMDDYDPFYLPF